MILVTGATGRVGYHLVQELADAGAPATAMVRVPARAADLPGAAGYLVASFDAPPEPAVLQGFERVFLLSPAREEQVELEVRFIDALVAAGHRPHVVKVATDGFQDPDCEVRFMRNHRRIAVHLEATGLPATYLAANLYMEDLLAAADSIRERGVLAAPAGDGRVGFVGAGDVAAAAAHVLTGSGHADRAYVLTGPEALGYADVADRMSAVFGREIGYEDVPPERARDQMLANGMPGWQADGTLELYDWVRNGGCDSVTDEVRKATGADPHRLEDWLAELRGAFVGRPRDVPPPRFG